LSKPSAPYDPLVLEMVSRATRDAPVAVMVKENPLGEWFTDIVGAVANLAPKIGETLSKVGIPFTGEVGRGIGDFAGGIRDMMPAKAANQNALVAASAAEKKVKPRVPVEDMQMARKQGAPKAKNVRVGAVGLSKNQRRKLKRKLKGKA